MRLKRFGLFATALALAVSVFGNIGIAPNAYAVAKTWTGAGGNNNFSTAANWSDNSVPVNGDSLNFSVTSLSADAILNNDLTGLSVVGVAFSGDSSSYYNYEITGSALTVTGPITSTATSSSYPLDQTISAPIVLGADTSLSNVNLEGAVTAAGYALAVNATMPCGVWISGAITGTGAITVSSAIDSGVSFSGNNSGFSGTFAVNSGAGAGFGDVGALGAASSLTASGARVAIGLNGQNRSLPTSLNLSGALTVSKGYGAVVGCGVGASDPSTTRYTLTSTGGLSLNGNLEYAGYFADTTINTPYTANGHTLSVKAGTDGAITLPAGTLEVQPETNTYADSVPGEYVNVGNKQTAILDGTRSGVSVTNGGVLKGIGTIVNGLTVVSGGIVAPGHSPGCLTSDTLNLAGTYEFELGGSVACSGYDQLKVLNGADTTPAVTIDDTSAVVSTSRFNGYTPTQGQVFVIIDQAGARAVQGTFKDLAEGATFEQNGVVFRVSYIGGDGNDVTLTVQNTPTAPDTGFMLVKTSPVITAVVAVAAALVLTVLGRKLRTSRR